MATNDGATDGTHDDAVREQFRIQAATFDDRGFATRGLTWIVDELRPEASDVVLDVAAGAMHLARALSPHVGHVCAIDLTPEMLDAGMRLAAEAGLRNVTAVLGNATTLPWRDGQFDLVVCRLTLHQVADPTAVVSEMVRVTRVGGVVAVVDMIVDEDPAIAAEANRLERLRDPSHNRTRPPEPVPRARCVGSSRCNSTTGWNGRRRRRHVGVS